MRICGIALHPRMSFWPIFCDVVFNRPIRVALGGEPVEAMRDGNRRPGGLLLGSLGDTDGSGPGTTGSSRLDESRRGRDSEQVRTSGYTPRELRARSKQLGGGDGEQQHGGEEQRGDPRPAATPAPGRERGVHGGMGDADHQRGAATHGVMNDLTGRFGGRSRVRGTRPARFRGSHPRQLPRCPEIGPDQPPFDVAMRGPGVEAPCWLVFDFARNCQLEAATPGPRIAVFAFWGQRLSGTLFLAEAGPGGPVAASARPPTTDGVELHDSWKVQDGASPSRGEIAWFNLL